MRLERLRVGVIGASINGGWASYAHMPALAAIPEIEITALATRQADSAARSAAAFGVRRGYGDCASLLVDPNVDLVVVSVKAPLHEQIALAALDAGKTLFLEWPMGANLAQSEAIARRAAELGLRGFVGIQSRAAPPMRHAAALIADGYLGRLTAVSVYGAYSYWGDPTNAGYSADVESGANILTIPAGHGLDIVRMLVGDIASLNARAFHRHEPVMARDLERPVSMTAPGAFAAVGTMASGALFSAHFDGMVPYGEVFRLALTGDQGELLLEGDGMPEVAPLRLSGTREKGKAPERITVPELENAGTAPPPGPAYNPYFLWRQIVQDLADGTGHAPDLATALESRRLIDAIARSAAQDGATIRL